MGNWNTLPTELKDHILDTLTEQSEVYCEWANVNRQFYNHGRSAWFKSLTFRANDKFMDTIEHSPFKPGKWVQEIKFDRNSVPSDWKEQLDITDDTYYDLERDPFYKMMQLCPNVTRVIAKDDKYGYHSNIDHACEYFYFIIVKTHLWPGLHVLPISKNHFKNAHYDAVHKYRQTLTELNVKWDLQDGAILKEFPLVTKLLLVNCRSTVKNILEIGKYLRLMPQLNALITMDHFGDDFEKDEEGNKASIIGQNHIFSNIATLNLDHWRPTSSQDLKYIMQAFPALERLDISEFYLFPMRRNIFTSDILTSFGEYVLNLTSFKLRSFGSDSIYRMDEMRGDRLLLKAIMLGRKSLLNKQPTAEIQSKLKLELLDWDDSLPRYENPGEYLLISNQDCFISVDWGTYEQELWDSLLLRFIRCFNSIELAGIYLSDVTNYFEAFLKKQNSIVKHIKLTNAKTYGDNPELGTTHYEMDSLEFEGRNIYTTANTLSPIVSSVSELTFSFSFVEKEERIYDDMGMLGSEMYDKMEEEDMIYDDFMFGGDGMKALYYDEAFVRIKKDNKLNQKKVTAKREIASLSMTNTTVQTLKVYDPKISTKEEDFYFSVKINQTAKKYYKWKSKDNTCKRQTNKKKVEYFSFHFKAIKCLILSESRKSSNRLELTL